MKSINLQDKYGRTTLIRTTLCKKVKKLINAGANLDIQDYNGYTALIHSIINKKLDIFQILIDSGADLNIQTKYGELGKTALHFASNMGYTKIVIVDLCRPLYLRNRYLCIL